MARGESCCVWVIRSGSGSGQKAGRRRVPKSWPRSQAACRSSARWRSARIRRPWRSWRGWPSRRSACCLRSNSLLAGALAARLAPFREMGVEDLLDAARRWRPPRLLLIAELLDRRSQRIGHLEGGRQGRLAAALLIIAHGAAAEAAQIGELLARQARRLPQLLQSVCKRHVRPPIQITSSAVFYVACRRRPEIISENPRGIFPSPC